jgi:hypothetical protein
MDQRSFRDMLVFSIGFEISRHPDLLRRLLLALHAAVANTFATCPHLVSAKTHRLLRNQAFVAWRQAASLTA